MTDDEEFGLLLQWIFTQANAYEKRERSRAEIFYSSVMLQAAAVLAEFTRTASFDNLIRAEKAFQQNDLVVYAKRPSTLASVQEGIDDFAAGEEVYRQLLHDTDAYRSHKYRKKNSVSPDNSIPVDTMRQALRGQMRRVGNYRQNVMGNPREQEFLFARVAMLRRAEKLYDAIQRERLA